jgi:MoaA/NifB/PqqE/SkfB family radical SAM enzyme
MCFYEDYAGSLLGSGLTSLVFSVHGRDAATHALHVGVPEAFEQALGGIRNAVRRAPAGVKLGMTTTLTRHNVGQLCDIADLALSLGLSSWALAHLAPFGSGYASLAPDEAAALDATRAVLDRYRGRLGLSVQNVPPCLLPGYEALVARDPIRASLAPAEEKISLPRYVADQRVRRPVCFSCPHAVGCAGFYDAARAPEPTWLHPRS